MNYELDGIEIELPPYTQGLDESFKNALNGKDGVKKKYDVLQLVIPGDILFDYFATDRISEIDLVKLETLFMGVYSTYQAPIIESNLKMASDAISEFLPLMEKFEALTKSSNERQGFRRVK